MPFIPVPSVVMAELIYSWDNSICENVLHYQVGAGVHDAADMLLLGNKLVDLWNTGLKAVMPATLQLNAVTLTDLTTATAAVVNVSVGLPVTGTSVSSSMPNSVALVITKRTAKRGRSYRGRIYHPGLTEANCINNLCPPPGLTTILNGWNGFISPAGLTLAWSMVVISRQHNKVEVNPGTYEKVVALTSDGILDSQRRRLPGRGR